MGNVCRKKNVEDRYEKLLNNKKNLSNEENCKEYFKLIKLKLRKFYEENNNNHFNISLSLDKKDFNTVTTAKKISINPTQKFIYWKDFLLQYLKKRTTKGCIWSSDITDYINSEIFLTENKWLSLFFWQEFEMRTKPKCLKSTEKNKEIDENNSNSSSFMITDMLSGSFCSINTDNLSINDPAFEYKEFRSRVKVYVNIFREHLFDNDHPINMVSKFFVKIYSAYIQDNLKELYILKNSKNPEFQKEALIRCDMIVKSLQKFIIKLQTALRLMYSKTINFQCFIEEKDEFINLVTNLIIKEGKLYEKLYELFEICLYDQIEVLHSKFNDMKSIKPEDLGIHEKFCLNENTIRYQKKLIEENQNKFKLEGEKTEIINKIEDKYNDVDSINNDIQPNSNLTIGLNIKESTPSQDFISLDIDNKNIKNELKIYSDTNILSSKKNKNKNYINYSCYEQAIKLFKSIKRYRTPFEKMMVIANISSEITESVNNYWKDMEKVITSSMLNIDADELMTIFIYIIIKSQMSDILIHSKFIKEFTTCTTRSTMIGYYYTTLEASLIYILEVKDKSELIKRDKLKNSLVPSKQSFNEDIDYSEIIISP